MTANRRNISMTSQENDPTVKMRIPDINATRPEETQAMRDQAAAMIDLMAEGVPAKHAERIVDTEAELEDTKARLSALEESVKQNKHNQGLLTRLRERFTKGHEATPADDKDSKKNRISGRTKVLGAVAVFAAGIGLAVALNDKEEPNRSGVSTEQTTVADLGIPQIGMNKLQTGANSKSQTGGTPAQTPTANSIGDAKTVAGAVDRLNIESTADRVTALNKYMDAKNKLKLNNINWKMNAMPANSNVNEMIAAAGLASVSSDKEGKEYGDAVYNASSIHNREISAPTGVSEAKQREWLEDFFTKKGSNKINDDYTHSVRNGFINPNTHEASAQSQHFNGERILIREVEGMGRVMFKITRDHDGKICLNVIRPVEESTTPTSHPTTPNVTPGTPRIVTDNPHNKTQPKDKMTPKNPHGKDTPKEDCKTNPSKPECRPPKKDEEKKDDGKLPGNPNVPADQDPSAGDQWGAGTAPAQPGITPHPEVEQPQDPTPPAIPDPGTPSVPAETNPDPGTTGPAEPGTGTENPAPQLPDTKPVG
jgi:hypothetical protein